MRSVMGEKLRFIPNPMFWQRLSAASQEQDLNLKKGEKEYIRNTEYTHFIFVGIRVLHSKISSSLLYGNPCSQSRRTR